MTAFANARTGLMVGCLLMGALALEGCATSCEDASSELCDRQDCGDTVGVAVPAGDITVSELNCNDIVPEDCSNPEKCAGDLRTAECQNIFLTEACLP